MKRKFVCEITGNSCFTYFEALDSEKNEMKKVEQHFPEPLKEPVLRFLQFSTVPRLDLLVDLVYSKFKSDFYPGENVLVKFQDTKKPAKIKEKARFNAFVDEFGVVRPEYCSYRVLFDNNTEVTIDESGILRDRSHFTKWYVKTFIKLSVSRSSKIGAPWIVREKFAKKYRIPMEYPPHLQTYAPKPILPKQPKSRKRPSTVPVNELQEANGSGASTTGQSTQKAKRQNGAGRSQTSSDNSQPRKLLPLKPRGPIPKIVSVKADGVNGDTKGASNHKGNGISGSTAKGKANTARKINLNDIMNSEGNGKQKEATPSEPAKHEIKEPSYIGPKPPPESVKAIEAIQGKPELARLQHVDSYLETFAPRKTVVDDLMIPYGFNYSIDKENPNNLDNLKPFNYFKKPFLKKIPELKNCISETLQTWIFLNVYHNALIIDTFTFDDFINSFKYKGLKNLELLNEVFCSVLSCFILGENEDPNLRIRGFEYSSIEDGSSNENGNDSNSKAVGKMKNDDKKGTNANGGSRGRVDDDETNALSNDTDLANEFPIPSDGNYEDEEFLLVTIPPERSYFDLDSDEENEDESDESDSDSEHEAEEKANFGKEETEVKEEKGSEEIEKKEDEDVKMTDIDGTDKEQKEEEKEEKEAPNGEKFANSKEKKQSAKAVKKEDVVEKDQENEEAAIKCKSEDNYGLDFNIYEDVELAKDKNDPGYVSANDEDSEDSDEDTTKKRILRNNVSKLLNYRNVSWQERLFKRNFKDGYWQIIVLGVLSLVDHVKRYKPLINEVNEILAPKSMSATPSTVLNQFHSKLSIDLKIKILNLLCELLVEGKIIRSYIDNAMDEATKLRRDRLDAIREYKAVMEHARDLNAECNTLLLQWKKDKKNSLVNNSNVSIENTETPEATATPSAVTSTTGTSDQPNTADAEKKVDSETKNKRRRRNFTLRSEITEDELAFAKDDLEYKKKIDARSSVMNKADEYRLVRKKLEKRLMEIDCQRVNIIGKDGLFNRYWWFENNGLPIIGKQSNKNSSSLNDDTANGGNGDDDDDDDTEEVQEETYLMGRLWIQGPSKDDCLSMLGVIAKDIENFNILKENIEEKVDVFEQEKQRVEKIKEKLKAKEEKPDELLKASETENIKDEVNQEGVKDVVKIETSAQQEEKPSTNDAPNGTTTTATEGKKNPMKIEDEEKNKAEAPKSEVSVIEREEEEPQFDKLPLSFIISAREIFDLEFSENGKTVKDKDGKVIYSINDATGIADQTLATTLTALQRKLIEEKPSPLLSSRDWRYLDSKKLIENLIRSLNPWGKRESHLRKELVALKESIDASIQARRKALQLDTPPEEELELEDEINKTYVSDSDFDSEDEEVFDIDEINSHGNRGKARRGRGQGLGARRGRGVRQNVVDPDSDDDEQNEVAQQVKEEEAQLSKRRTRRSVAQEKLNVAKLEEKGEKEQVVDIDIDNEENENRNGNGNANKTANASQANKENTPMKRVSKRELKRKRMEEHEEKKTRHLSNIKRLNKLRSEREKERCLEWVNSCAQQRLGHTHYEGPPKTKSSNSGSGRKKGRK